jgi:hypothetical protein
MKAKELNRLFQQWCQETGRSGGVLVGKSFREFFNYVEEQTSTSGKLPAPVVTPASVSIKTGKS